MGSTTAIVAAFGLACLLACGGGGAPVRSEGTPPGAPTSASGLAYTDPVGGSFQLRRNAVLSKANRLVLELWGPDNLQGCGCSLALRLDASLASWVPADPATTSLALPGNVWSAAGGTPIFKATVHADALQAVVADKGCGQPKSLHGPLLQVALELRGTGVLPGKTLSLTVDTAGSRLLAADGTLQPLLVAVGSLTAQ